MISSRFLLQSLPPNDSLWLQLPRVTLWMPASDVLRANSAYNSEFSQSKSTVRRYVVLRYSSTSFSLISSMVPEIHCSSPANISSALVRTRLARKDQSWYAEGFPTHFVSALKAPPSVTCFREVPRVGGSGFVGFPAVLKQSNHQLSHTDLFLQRLCASLWGRHHRFQSPAIRSTIC